ncbi:MAG: hypothetical protein AB7G06_04375 [Bdellovibrionales bacterium]
MSDDKVKNGGKMGMITFVVGLALACAFFGSTMLLVFAGMLPTIVAMITDRSAQKTAGIAISVMNFGGVLPFIISLWQRGASMSEAVKMLADPFVWLVMYAAAGIGWGIYTYVPKIVANYVALRAQTGIAIRQQLQQQLLNRWGERVSSDKPISKLESEQ